jgi:hypothetical protein
VRLQIGPVSATSVRAWVGYAREALAEVLGDPGTDDIWIPQDTVTTFEHYLDEWEAAATGVEEMQWEHEIPADEAEYLSHAFFRIASNLAARAEQRGHAAAPPAAEEFYRCLVTGFLGALEAEGRGSQEFSEHLRSFWPGMEDDK